MEAKSLKAMGLAAFLTASTAIGAPITMYREGVSLTPYYDKIAKKTTWCAGETEKGYQDHFTYDQCGALFKIRYGYYSYKTSLFYTDVGQSTVTPEIHAAITDMSYNVGLGTVQQSSMISNINSGNAPKACEAILKYKYAGGYDCSTPGNHVCPGIWDRRLEMNELCKSGLH